MSPASQAESGPRIKTSAGLVEGRAEGSLLVFKGIPYAAPPVGAARWKPPAPLAAWSGVRSATDFGPSCAQPPVRYSNIYTSDISPVGEDCLTLNVWAPAGANKAPVFVWIHGGAMVRGSSRETLYEGARLAEQGIIVVSINYRLGVFGYLAHPELSAESPLGISGNYGLLDQIESLNWIKRNIAAFGGDPSNVTIAGESSGGLSVLYLMAAPGARGLFSKAIAQSSYMISMPELKQARFGQLAAEDIGVDLLAKLQVADVAALRAMDAESLADAAAMAFYFPLGTVDGLILERQLVEVFERGEQAPVPILAGFNSGEIRSLKVLAPPPPATTQEYETIIRERYLDLADEFLRLYPGTDMQESIYATTRDALYGWTAERLARNQLALGQSSYLYLFDHGYPDAENAGLHAFHASELPYMFGNLARTPPLWPKIPDSPQETGLSTAMLEYWSSFARSGQPRAANQADWPAYGPNSAYMVFRDTPQPAEHLYPGMYELHEEAVCRRRASDAEPWHWNAGIISPKLSIKPETNCK